MFDLLPAQLCVKIFLASQLHVTCLTYFLLNYVNTESINRKGKVLLKPIVEDSKVFSFVFESTSPHRRCC